MIATLTLEYKTGGLAACSMLPYFFLKKKKQGRSIAQRIKPSLLLLSSYKLKLPCCFSAALPQSSFLNHGLLQNILSYSGEQEEAIQLAWLALFSFELITPILIRIQKISLTCIPQYHKFWETSGNKAWIWRCYVVIYFEIVHQVSESNRIHDKLIFIIKWCFCYDRGSSTCTI